MKRKKLIKVLIGAGIAIALFVGGIIGIRHMTSPRMQANISSVVETKSDIRQSIIEEMRASMRLEVMTTEVKQSVLYKGGLADNFLTRNNKEIDFVATGRYSINFDKIKDDDIVVNEQKKEILINLGKMDVSIEFNEKSTQFRTAKGLLIFADTYIKPEVYEKLKSEVREDMISGSKRQEYMEQAEIKAQEQLQQLLSKVTRNNYKIKLNFIG